MPILMPGGFRSRAGMEAALASGEVDVIGLARPLCTMPDLPRRLLDGTLDEAPAYEREHATKSTGFTAKLVNLLGQMGWYYAHLEDLGDGKPLKLDRGIGAAFVRYMAHEYGTAWRMQRSD